LRQPAVENAQITLESHLAKYALSKENDKDPGGRYGIHCTLLPGGISPEPVYRRS
jgi:hypothetical protein